MKLSRHLIFLAALGSAMSALACDAPAGVNIPRGDEATRDEMVAAQTSVREFMTAMEEYLACMDAEIDALAEEVSEEDRNLMVEQRDSGVGQMEEVAAEFNEQRQAFNERACGQLTALASALLSSSRVL